MRLHRCVLFALVCMGMMAPAWGAVMATHMLLDGGDWRIAPDPANAGRDARWFDAPRAEAVAAAVPGILQIPLPGYHGVAWYWRTFDAPPHPDTAGRYLLRFNAVDYYAEVWINGTLAGKHEGGETPFTLDVTEAVKSEGSNLLAVRVLNPTEQPTDGIVLAETPHRNKYTRLTVGGSYNSGGITESVELILAPRVRIDDIHVQPDWKTGEVRITTSLVNATTAAIPVTLNYTAAPNASAAPVAAADSAMCSAAPGESTVETTLTIAGHRLWDVVDPYLYRLAVTAEAEGGPVADVRSVRFGFRDFRVEKGYFRLNGRRVFLRSSHTGNHCPIGQIVAPGCAPDLLRKDLLYAKSCGLNCVRFISGMAHPYQLDLCDEIGLMVYEEDYAAWLLGESPHMAERFDSNLREMLLRDRNHPSIVIWGLLNEMQDGAVVRHAVASLPLLRSLDASRLVLQQSGRWDKQYAIGSVCNPGSTAWECMWGGESPDNPKVPEWFNYGYCPGAGDAHFYPPTPQSPEMDAIIRNLGKDMKPVFLSEYGIGSLMNAIRERRYYDQYGADPASDDYRYFKDTEEKLTADWRRLGFDGVYAFPEDMLRASQRLHCRQRLMGFDCIRSNPNICGYNLTGLLDHGFTGEGLWTYWREFKSGIAEALQDGFAPVRWCLFASPLHAYAGRPIKLEAVLANEDVLAPGEYPVTLRVMGAKGVAWEQAVTAVIPQPAPGEDGPLAVPVYTAEIVLPEPGTYTFAANMERGGAPAGGRLALQVTEEMESPLEGVEIAAIGLPEDAVKWLARHVNVKAFDEAPADACGVTLVGALDDAHATAAQRTELLRRVACGGVAIFLGPGALRNGDDPVAWLPLKNKGACTGFPDWLYHKECVAKNHPLFEGLPGAGIMDWDYYGPVISRFFLEGQDTPVDTAAAAFAICHSSRPDGYAAGVMLGAYAFGEGLVVLNTFNVLENLDRHPAADRLLLNLVQYAKSKTRSALAQLPADFEEQCKAVGY